jgi:hypothetical protein
MKQFFKTFKQEMISIPALFAAFFGLNWLLGALFPNSAFFDVFSEFENIFYGVVRFVVVLAVSWFGLRIILPVVFKFLKEEYYNNFNTLDKNLKYILTTAIFLGFILAGSITAKAQSSVRNELLNNLNEQLDVREITSNSSPMIDKYLQHVGFNYPVAWCAAFVSYNLHQVGVANPNSAWSPSFANAKDVIWYGKTGYKNHDINAQCGDVVTFYYSRLKRVGHVGFYIKTDKSGYFITIEGNTNTYGSRTGDGVYKKKRDPRKVYAISRYIKSV